jgi:hypothetical protein
MFFYKLQPMKRMLQRPQYIPPVHRMQLLTIARQNRVIREQAALIRRLGEKAAGKIGGERRQQPGGQAAIKTAEPVATLERADITMLVALPVVLLAIAGVTLFGSSYFTYHYNQNMRMRMQENDAAEKAAIERDVKRAIPQFKAVIEARVQAELKAREQRKREFEAAFTRPSGSDGFPGGVK